MQFSLIGGLTLLSFLLSASQVTAVETIPARVANDPYFTSQWNLHNKGPGATPMGKGRIQGSDHAHVAEAWQFIVELRLAGNLPDIGRDIRLGVIDDGFDLQHDDLKEKYVASRNFGGPVLENNLFSLSSPKNFHGTLVSGLAVASGDNGKGIVGACPGCRLVAARMAPETPQGLTTEEYYEQIFAWMLAQKADVINCSWGPDKAMTPGFAEQLMERLAREGRNGKGTIVVFAAGNSGQDFAWNHFASHPAAISVGASNSSGIRHGFSNFGEGLDIMAPTSGGQGNSSQYIDPIWTTDNYLAPDCLKNTAKPSSGCSDKAGWTPNSPVAGGDGWEGRYSYRFSHTSSAAPIISGVAALILHVNPELTAEEVQTILQQTADKIAPKEAKYDANGRSLQYGYGRVNALRAVAKAYESSGRVLTAEQKAGIDQTLSQSR